ncbi:MAG: type II toxin-antitoxin system RelE/ParE family toxin [Opitutae bacterium]|nr:type II toxin-antitoxin system RelE/ParE family toxin [Opitutae bacterium]
MDFIAGCKDINPEYLERLAALLEYSARYGPPPIASKFKHLTATDQLFEFKSAGGLRLFCFFDDGRLIVCTHGTIKKAQRTRTDELDLAHDWKRRYEAAKKAGNLIHETEHE